MAIETAQESQLDRVLPEYREALRGELDASANTVKWLSQLTPKQEWVLQYTEADAFMALAEATGHQYKPSRVEEPPTKGKELLELAQRIHTGVDALESGEMKWGTGNVRIQNVDSTSKQAIIDAIFAADNRLIEVLINTSPDKKILMRNPAGQVVKEMSPVDVIVGISQHANKHADMLRVLLDGTKDLFPKDAPTMPQTPIAKTV